MARHYEIFYCLENFIRELVRERLEEAFGLNWWDVEEPRAVVPPSVKENVRRNVERGKRRRRHRSLVGVD